MWDESTSYALAALLAGRAGTSRVIRLAERDELALYGEAGV